MLTMVIAYNGRWDPAEELSLVHQVLNNITDGGSIRWRNISVPDNEDHCVKSYWFRELRYRWEDVLRDNGEKVPGLGDPFNKYQYAILHDTTVEALGLDSDSEE